jgi:hypothetical protein
LTGAARPETRKPRVIEWITAAALVVIADQTARRVYGWADGSILILGALYAVKMGLVLQVRRRAIVVLGYSLAAAVAVAWPLSREWSNPHVTPIGLALCVPMILLTLPTLSLVADLLRRPGPRVLLWRSVFEIGVVYPFWAFGASYVSLFYLGGWWI